jgi:hypothetical protein
MNTETRAYTGGDGELTFSDFVDACPLMFFVALFALFGGRRYATWDGFVVVRPGIGWPILAEVLQTLASKLPNQGRIRTGWDGPEIPEPPEPEPASTKRPDGMTTTGWDDPHGTERP